MPDTGWKYAGVTVSNHLWQHLYSIEVALRAQDTAYINTPALIGDPAVAVLRSFGFSIPSGANIEGIQIGVRCWTTYGTYPSYIKLRMSKDSGSTWSDQKSDIIPTSAYTHYFGSSTDLWSYSWDDSSFGDSNFYVELLGYYGSGQPIVDYLWVKVFYSTSTPVPISGSFSSASGLFGDLGNSEILSGIISGGSSLSGEIAVPVTPCEGVISASSNLVATFAPDITDKLLSANLNGQGDLRGILVPSFSITPKENHVVEMLDRRLEQFK